MRRGEVTRQKDKRREWSRVSHSPSGRKKNGRWYSRKGETSEEDNTEANGEGTSVLVGESLRQQQQEDPKFEQVVKLRLANGAVPSNEEIQTESELTMKMVVVKRQELEVHDEVVYRRKVSPRSGEPDFKQLLLPRTQVEKATLGIVYGSPEDEVGEDYDSFVEQIRQR